MLLCNQERLKTKAGVIYQGPLTKTFKVALKKVFIGDLRWTLKGSKRGPYGGLKTKGSINKWIYP